MSSRVQALNVTHVKPAAQVADPPPRDGNDDDAIKLSVFDSLFIALTPIQRLFFYEGDDLPAFATLSGALQSSLAVTLAVFTPLAGTVVLSTEGDVVIDCSHAAVSAGIKFTEAEYAGDADAMRRLAADAEHDSVAFQQLVPTLPVSVLPAPVLAVQVTRPAEGLGVVAVGVSVNHAVADGQSMWQFMRAWAAAARDGSPARDRDGTGLPPPTFDRAAINRHPKADEAMRIFLHGFAPDLPKVNTFPEPDLAIQRTRTYRLGADQIRSLKQRISLQGKSGGEAPTTYAAVASLVWTSIVRASKDRHDEDDTYVMFAADCRGRLRPPMPAAFFGNCVKMCYARATAGELRAGEGGLARGASAVREAVREYLEDPLGDAERWLQRHEAVVGRSVVTIGSSHRFAGYETDFGWGAPCRVELGSVFMREYVALLGAPDGAVQVTVALDRDRIDGFQAGFLSLLHA